MGSVRGFPIFERYDDVDTAAVILRLTDGTLAVLGQTRHDPRGYDIRMEIIGRTTRSPSGSGRTRHSSIAGGRCQRCLVRPDDVPDPLRACLPG